MDNNLAVFNSEEFGSVRTAVIDNKILFCARDVAVALGLAEHYLQGRGAYRVHGGGFAGTIQAFVPYDLLDAFVAGMDAALGEGACHVLSIRPHGGVEAFAE